jgi:hypothetical protein
MIDITPVAEALIALLAAVVTAVVVPWVRRKASAEESARVAALVRTAVAAVEQIYDGAEGHGDEKKAFVLDFLKEKGLTLDPDEIEMMLEAAVYELTGAAKKE